MNLCFRHTLLSLFVISFSFTFCKGQSINTEFGKNRVQFHDDFNDWWMYETENFITYWYGKSKQVAISAMQMAESDHALVQKILEHRMNDKIEILVYTDLSDLKQSNIGTEETFASKGGETKIVGNKMFIYFDGDHSRMRQKIREGLAEVYFNNMLFGSNFQQVLQNAVLLNLPEWYKKGIVAYAASPWNKSIESEVREIWLQGDKFHSFEKLAATNPRLAGHSLWYYLDQNYGKSSITNIIYLTKISRGLSNSFEYILNVDFEVIKEEWKTYYENYFEQEKNMFQPLKDSNKIKLKNSKFSLITQLKSSPDGRYLAYAHNIQGKYRIELLDTKTKKTKTIFKYGYRNQFQETDYNYPLICWLNNSKELTYVFEHKDVIKLVKYKIDKATKEQQIIPTAIQRIYSFDYVDELNYIMSANVDGYANLYYYKYRNRNHGFISQDFFDNLDATYVNYKGKKGILFSSNRDVDSIKPIIYDTILPIKHFDLYFLADGSKIAENITNTPDVSERHPRLFDERTISYTSNFTGINNLYTIDLLTRKSTAKTNLDRNITSYEIDPSGQVYITINVKNKFIVNKFLLSESFGNPKKTHAVSDLSMENILMTDTGKTETWSDKYLFQSIYDDPESHTLLETNNAPEVSKIKNVISTSKNIETEQTIYTQPKKVEPYYTSRAVAANYRFGFNSIVTKMDNDILFEGLESYTGDQSQVLNAPLGLLFKANIKDLFEDYSIDAGIRIPTTFNGSETFIVFDNRKKRIDRRFALYRKSTEYNTSDPGATFLSRSKKTSVLGLYQLKYPFDIYRSIRATSSLRFDKFIPLSTENVSFESRTISEKRISLKLEYVYDNTFDAGVNIKHGLRFKIFNEAINQFDVNFIDGVKFSLSDGFTDVLGFDARYYIPILKKSVLAIRGAGATSFGNKKMLYYLGGVENNILRRFDNSIPVPDDGSFAYKVNAFHLRGFQSNIRNGSTFVVSNTELRVPIFQYILGPNRGTPFIRNLQITCFFDAGLAFFGTSPFSEKNKLNQLVIQSPPLIELQVEYFRDPLVMGFGYGVRSQILGYFVKLDYGYGIETRAIQKPALYISIGMDF